MSSIKRVFYEYEGRTYGTRVVGKAKKRLRELLEPPDKDIQDFDVLKDKHKGKTAYVIAPGPTLEKIDKAHFKDKITIGLNNVAFYHNPTYWVMAEIKLAGYINKLYRKGGVDTSVERTIVAAPGPAWALDRSKEYRCFKKLYISRFRGIDYLPDTNPCWGEIILGAIGLAWWTGCKQCYIFGLDMGAVDGKCYVDGVPEKSGRHGYPEQVKALQDFKYKESMNITNVNNYNLKFPFETITIEEYYKRIK